ncbi:glycosyltransferase family 4 protein [Maribacter litoralis]|uniref:glycosyltransferase family 4 protein n=1 Tax=Maribacter litoralis TaxID=2059726 RepID=UPI003F5CDDE9
MKIFLVSNMYPSSTDPDYGIFVKNFKENFESLHGVSFVESVIKGRANGLLNKFFSYSSLMLSVIKNYLNGNYDIIYIHFISHTAPAFFLPLLFFPNKKPIIVNVHGADVIKYNKGLYKFFNGFLLKKSSLLVTPSNYFKQICINEFSFLPEDSIFVNPSGGIDSLKFSPKFSSKKDYKVVSLGFISRIEEDKGWKDFIDVIQFLLKKEYKVQALMAGTGSQVNELKKMIKVNNLKQIVDYKGLVSHDKLIEIYQELDLFIFSSNRISESLGLVGLEAMACGIPVIAYDMAGPKTYIINKSNGYLVNPGDSFEIAKSVINYFNLNVEDKLEMQRKAILTANNFDSISVSKKLYEKVKSSIAS